VSRAWFPALLAAALAVVLTFLVLPVVAIFTQQPPGALLDALGEQGALDALWLSLRTTAARCSPPSGRPACSAARSRPRASSSPSPPPAWSWR
jgi:hypothetical protein